MQLSGVRSVSIVALMALASFGQVVTPATMPIVVCMIDAIDLPDASPGQECRATLDEPVEPTGTVVATRGSDALVRLAEVAQSGKLTGCTELTLAVAAIVVGGEQVAVEPGENVTASGLRRGGPLVPGSPAAKAPAKS